MDGSPREKGKIKRHLDKLRPQGDACGEDLRGTSGLVSGQGNVSVAALKPFDQSPHWTVRHSGVHRPRALWDSLWTPPQTPQSSECSRALLMLPTRGRPGPGLGHSQACKAVWTWRTLESWTRKAGSLAGLKTSPSAGPVVFARPATPCAPPRVL